MVVVAAFFVATAAAQHRPKVGLVLGGGGAKGAAEVGVLKYIEQSKVPIDYIVGTSIGSIVGGLYSCGYRSAELETLFRSQKWMELLTDRDEELRSKPIKKRDGQLFIFGFPIGGKHKEGLGHGVLRGDSICSFLTELTERPDSMSFDKLPIPFRCVAVEATSFTEKVFDRGKLAECMRASMAIPLAFKPVVKDSLVYVDGGLLNNLPVDVCRAMGADIIIAVDLTQNHHDDEDETAIDIDIPDEAISKLVHRPRLLQMISWASKRPDLAKYHQNLKDVDIYINPELKGMGAASFSHAKIDRMIIAGEKAGKKALPQLKKLRKRLHRKK